MKGDPFHVGGTFHEGNVGAGLQVGIGPVDGIVQAAAVGAAPGGAASAAGAGAGAGAGSTWQVRIYTENTNDQSGLQSEIIDSEKIDLKFTNATLFGGIDTPITADAYGDDTDGDLNNAAYAFVPDVDEAVRIFASDANFGDVVLGEDFRFATKITDAAIGGTYSTTVYFDLLIDIPE